MPGKQAPIVHQLLSGKMPIIFAGRPQPGMVGRFLKRPLGSMSAGSGCGLCAIAMGELVFKDVIVAFLIEAASAIRNLAHLELGPTITQSLHFAFNSTTLSMSEIIFEALHSITTKNAMEYAAKAKEHPIGIAMGALGLLAFHAIHKSVRRSTMLSHVPGPKAPSLVWGHLNEMHDPVNGSQIEAGMLEAYGTTCRVKGMMGVDDLWTADPRAIYEVLVKEVEYFHQSPNFALLNATAERWMEVLIGKTLINTHGQTHKHLRKVITILDERIDKRLKQYIADKPRIFTKTHARLYAIFLYIHGLSQFVTDKKLVVPTLGAIVDRLEGIFRSKVQEAGQPSTTIDVYHWCHYVGLEMIGQAAMGHSFRLMEGKEPPYIKAAGQLFPTMFAAWYIRPFLPLLVKMGPKRFQRFVVGNTPIQTVQQLKSISDVMNNEGVRLLRSKQEAAANGTLYAQVAAGKDIMTLLLEQNKVMPPEEQMHEAELAAQVNGAAARIIHLLAIHQDIQTTLRNEISEAFEAHGSDLDYDQLNSLRYLEAICRETLRLFPPVVALEKVAQKDCTLPLQYPIKSKDGKTMITEVTVQKGTNVYVSLVAPNRNKAVWGENADEFKPSRWLGELPLEVQDTKHPGIFSSLMTFGGGSHACIGFKFTQIEIKVIITKLVNSFKFEPASGTRINWESDGVVKPYAYSPDGTKSPTHSMPLKVSLV
ncbi:cytochrome P450, partial [Rhizoctonia solani]